MLDYQQNMRLLI